MGGRRGGSSLARRKRLHGSKSPWPIGVMVASVPPQIIISRGAALDNFEESHGVRGSGASRRGGGIRPRAP